MKTRKKLLVVILLSISSSSFCEVFSNHFLSFQKPPGWECEMLKTEWVCQHEDEERKREALIIFAAKIRSDTDSLSTYSAYLKKNKVLKLSDGSNRVSEVKYTRLKKINGQNYVDSLHYQSEIAGYYTRYLGTVKSDMGILLTFSVQKSYYSRYKDIFEKVISSLRVFNKRSDFPRLKKRSRSKSIVEELEIGSNRDDVDLNIDAPGSGKKTSGGGAGGDDVWLYLLGLVGIGGYIFMRKSGKL